MVPPSLFGMGTTAHRKQHVQEFYSGTKNQLGDRCEDLNESPLQLLQAQKAQARPAESSMRILSFGPRAEYSYRSSTSIWGMSGSITLYADVPGFSIKLSANSNQSSPWGQRLILLKGTMKVLQAQLDPTQQRCPPLEHLLVVLPYYPLPGNRNEGYNYIHMTILTQTKHMPIEACL
ncbi:hypothetical protein YC2023_082212 [Brassica napus]